MKYVCMPEVNLKVNLSWNPVTRGRKGCFSSLEGSRLNSKANLYPFCRISVEPFGLNEQKSKPHALKRHVCSLCNAKLVTPKCQHSVCDRFDLVRKIKCGGNHNRLGSFEQFEGWRRVCRRITALFSSWLTKIRKRSSVSHMTPQITYVRKLVWSGSFQSHCVYVPIRNDNLKLPHQSWTLFRGYTLIPCANTGSFHAVGGCCRETVILHHTYN